MENIGKILIPILAIVFFSLLVNIILPQKKMGKIVNVFVSMLVMILLINSIANIVSTKENIVFDSSTFGMDNEEYFSCKTRNLEQLIKTKLSSVYEIKADVDIEFTIENEKCIYSNCSLKVSHDNKEISDEKIREVVCEFIEVSVEGIKIYGR